LLFSLRSIPKETLMKRIIVDYKKLTPEILGLLVEKYPDGYDDDQIISFKNAKNETVDAVEVRTEDSIYLVKVSTRLENTMANYDEDDYDESDFNEPIVEIPEKSEETEEDMEEEDDL
jgi:hypothetical protein